MADEYNKIQAMLDQQNSGSSSDSTPEPSRLQQFSWLAIHFTGGILGISIIAMIVMYFESGPFT